MDNVLIGICDLILIHVLSLLFLLEILTLSSLELELLLSLRIYPDRVSCSVWSELERCFSDFGKNIEKQILLVAKRKMEDPG